MNEKTQAEIEAEIKAITDEAQTDSLIHTDINVCCPYPFNSPVGRLYRAAFVFAKTARRTTDKGDA